MLSEYLRFQLTDASLFELYSKTRQTIEIIKSFPCVFIQKYRPTINKPKTKN